MLGVYQDKGFYDLVSFKVALYVTNMGKCQTDTIEVVFF